MRNKVNLVALGLIVSAAMVNTATAGSINPIECEIVRAPTTTTAKPAPMNAGTILGTTPQEIKARFATIQEMNFQGTHDPEAMLSRLSDKELSRIAAFYNESNTNSRPHLLNILARRVSSPSLVRVSRAFGSAAVAQAVKESAPAATQMAFVHDLAAAKGAIPTTAATIQSTASPGYALMAAGAAPNIDMTLEEIYLDFRTAPVGSLSVESALTETAFFAGSRLLPAAAVGTAIGTELNNVIDQYDPELGDAIGGTIYGMIEEVKDALTPVQQGQSEGQIDQSMGAPLKDNNDYSGDYNVGASYEDYEGGGSC